MSFVENFELEEHEEESLDTVLESSAERRARIISLYIAHFSMFLSGFGNAIIYIGMFPYIQAVSSYQLRSDEIRDHPSLNPQLEPEVTLFEYGIVVAADAAAQMVFSPVFGLIIDK